MALPILLQKDEGPSLSLAGPPGLAVFLRDLDSDRRAKTETELVWYYVASPNPWLLIAYFFLQYGRSLVATYSQILQLFFVFP